MKKFYFLVSVILYFFSSNVFGGVFDPPPSDKSVELLGTIFGSNVGTIYLGGSASPVLSAMFEKLNIIIVAVGTVVISYIGLVSTINTAQEGQAMGKKWSSIWLPMRSMMGMLLMVPAPGSGYSMIQVTVLWAILQGIGAADAVWTMVLNYLSQGISATSALTINPEAKLQLEQSGKKLAENILNSAVCLESIKKIANGQATDSVGVTIPASYFINQYGPITRVYQTTPTIFPDPRNGDPPIDPSNKSATVTYKGYLNVGAKNPSESGNEGDAYSTMCGSYKVEGQVMLGDLDNLNLSGQTLVTEAYKRAEDAMNQKFLALNTMISILRPIAKKLIDGEVNPKNGERLADSKPSPSGYIFMARDAYRDILSSIIKPILADSSVQDAVDKGMRAGWVVAGSFYFVLNAERQQSLLPTATVAPVVEKYFDQDSVPSCPRNACLNKTSYDDINQLSTVKEFIGNPEERKYIAERLLDGSTYYKNDQSSSRISGSIDLSAAGGEAAALIGPLQEFTTSTITWLAEEMEKNSMGDPLLGHAAFGSRLMLGAEIAWLAIIGISLLISLGGIAICGNSVFMTIVSALMSVLPVVIAILGLLWMCGATLAIYVPMIPYMIYTVAVLGWFLLVIEAVVSAPIVALGFVLPSGEELGRVTSGLMLLVGVVLRPTLMIFGFILAARLYRAVVQLVNFGMADTFSTIPITGSLLSPFAAMILYASFVVVLANKCFSLIYIVPDKILRWIGGHPESTDVDEVKQAKGKFESGAKGFSDAGEGASSGAMKKAAKANEDRAKDGSGMKAGTG